MEMTETRLLKSVFEADTEFEATGDNKFAAAITDRWNGLHGRPLGGYVLAVCLRPLGSLVPFPDLLVVSAFFLRPVDPGRVEIRTEVVRIGGRTATGEARLFQHGMEALRATATFTDHSTQHGDRLVFGRPPDLPDPASSIDLRDGPPLPPSSVAKRVEYRVADLPGWRLGRPSGDPYSQLWIRLIEGGDDDTLTLPFLVDVAAPAVMEIGATGSTTVELTVHARARPARGWKACRASTRFVSNGYHEEDFELWDDAGNLIAQARQLAILDPPLRT